MRKTYIRTKLLPLLQENPGITQREMAEILGCHADAINDNIKLFVNEGLIEKELIYQRGFVKKYRYKVL